MRCIGRYADAPALPIPSVLFRLGLVLAVLGLACLSCLLRSAGPILLQKDFSRNVLVPSPSSSSSINGYKEYFNRRLTNYSLSLTS